MNINNIEVVELNFGEEFLEMDFSDAEISAAFGVIECCNTSACK